jgi:glycosyltransferase involved in cell wall biosynthesis
MTITVIIPYYNAENTLHRAIESVVTQDFPINELILVDNNSVDKSNEIAYELAKKYQKILLINEKMQGANFARNTGAALATGDWLQFLDADDELLPGKLSHQAALIQTFQKDVGLICAAAIIEVLNVKNISHRYIKPVPEDIIAALISGLAGTTCSNLWNKKIFDQVGGWDTKYKFHDDPILVFNYLLNGAGIFIDNQPLTLVHQDLTIDSVSRPQALQQAADLLSETDEYYDKIAKYIFKQYPDRSDYRQLIQNQRALIYCNYTFQYGSNLHDEINAFKNKNDIRPDFLTKLRAYYYYLINNKVNSSGVLNYPILFWQAILNSHKLFQ